MQASWWQYRGWKFITDMNGDGALSGSDALLWAQWLFFLPGDAFIAYYGPTELGRYLGLTQASFGSATSAGLSVLLWAVAVWAALYLFGFLLDAIDPTYRQQQRESRQARARARRDVRAQARAKADELEPIQRIEPTLPADFQIEAPLPEVEAKVTRPRRASVG